MGLSRPPRNLETALPYIAHVLSSDIGLREIGIIGTGRFGAYFARQLERIGCRVHGADARDAPHERARALQRACAAQAVIYAVPIRSLEQAVLETRELLAPGAVVMDVCSVKVVPCALLQRHLPTTAILGTHPLFGPDSAPESCAGQTVALCAIPAGPSAPASGVTADRVERLFRALGLRVVRCTPADHDQQIARSQFLTHLIGRATVRCGITRVPLSTKSHDALMDIVDVVCHDTLELFEDMAAFNPMARRVGTDFLAALHAIDEELARREREARLLTAGADANPSGPAPDT
jgi:prephenate dehydrogenase